MSGADSRASVNLTWRRQFIDDVGQVWTPFAYARADAFFFRPDLNGFQNTVHRELPADRATIPRCG